MVSLGVLTSIVVSFGVGALVLHFGESLGFLDRPDGDLKTHERAAVPLGGLAVLAGIHIGLAVAGIVDLVLLAVTAFIWLVGLIDDREGLTPITRLVAAAVAGAVLGLGHVGESGALPVAALLALVVISINAVNLLDGLDAVAGGVSAVGLIGLSGYALLQDRQEPFLGLVAAGAILGFLLWNRPPARLFLGDNGAYVVGVMLAWAVVLASADWSAALVATALIGVPFLDLVVTVARRAISRSALFAGDRDHTYDRMRRAGYTVGRVAVAHAGAQAIWMTAIIVVSIAFGDYAAFAVALVTGVIVVMFLLWRSTGEPAAGG